MALPKEKQPREARRERPLDKKQPTRETAPREKPGFFRGARIR